MKPPWQARPQQYVTTSTSDHPQQRSSTVRQAPPSISSTPMILSHMYGHQHGTLQHPAYLAMFSKPSDLPYHVDPRSSVSAMGGSASRSYPSASTQSSAHPPYQPRRSTPLRVSLLRDIGIAGERDRDVSGSGASSAELHGAVGHSSVAMLHGSHGRPADRSSSAMSSGLHTPYQHHVAAHGQDITQMRHSMSSPPQRFVAMSPQAQTEIKKEPSLSMKQDNQSRLPGHLASELPEQHSVPQLGLHRQSSVSSTKSDYGAQPDSSLIEQKSKEDLVQAMVKVDREIAKVETEIDRLERRKTQLEEKAKQPPEAEKADASQRRVEPKHRDLWQVIYAENRKKAEDARSVLNGLCERYNMPLYNQPSDTQVYQDNLRKNEEMRPKLLSYFQRYIKLQNIRERYLCARYDQLMDDWHQKAEEIESNPKRKAKEAKTREFFEKLFPEVRKQREQQERIDRVGTRGDTCRSEADFAEIVDGLSEQENQLQHMRQLAVIPPMLLDNEQRRVKFINDNGFIREPFKDFKESQQLDSWSDQEKAIFKEKYVSHPKIFHVIASFIDKKSVADCILYYYLTKKTNHYKALVRKQTLKPKKVKSGRAHASHQNEQSTTKEDRADKDELKKEAEQESDDPRIDKPPSPRMTRARKQTMNWTEEEISLVKEGFGKHGRDFSLISRMVANKSEQQVKNFYHNYKKKHGLDQLITESKKKKTNETRRTRQQAQSPDTATMTKDDDSTERRQTDSSSSFVDDKKMETEKEKPEEAMCAEEKRAKSKERAPSPASSKAGSDVSDTTPLSTTHIRTRRTAARAAAANASHDSASTDATAGSKRPASDKLSASAQEPVEKKQKKSERRRKKSNSESSSKDRSDTEKSDVKSENTKLVEEAQGASSAAERTSTASPAAPETKQGSDVREEQSETKAASAQARTLRDSPEKRTKENVKDSRLAIARSEDHDSSATCSADEDGAQETVVWKIKEKGPTDAYDFNDSPTIIRLETARSSAASNVTTSTSVTSAGSTVQNTLKVDPLVLNLASKAVSVLPTSIPVTARTSTSRPQSLPPPGASIPLASLPIRPSAPPVLISTLVPPVGNASRPSSTPGAYDITGRSPATTHGRIEPAVVARPPTVATLPLRHAPQSSAAPVIEDIRNLTYTAGKIIVPASSSSLKTFAVAVPQGMDLTTSVKSSTARPLPTASLTSIKVEATPTSRPPVRPPHRIATIMQKDFSPASITLPSAVHAIPTISSNFHRSYSEKDIQAMSEKAAVIPSTPVPVSALRFTTAKTSTIPQAQRPVPASAALKQILATKPSDIKGPGKEDMIHAGLGTILHHSSVPPGAVRHPFNHLTALSVSKEGTIAFPIPVSSLPFKVSAPAAGYPVPIHHMKQPTRMSILDPSAGVEKAQPPKAAPIIRSAVPPAVKVIASTAPSSKLLYTDFAAPAKSVSVSPTVISGQPPTFLPTSFSPNTRFTSQGLPVTPSLKMERPQESQSKVPAAAHEGANPRVSRVLIQNPPPAALRSNTPYNISSHITFAPPGMEYKTPTVEGSMSRKKSEEARSSPKPVSHFSSRSASPQQQLVPSERKQSRPGPPKHTQAEMLSRHPSPLPTQSDKSHKEESRRPGSASQFAPERQARISMDPVLSDTHQRSLSAQSFPGAPKSQPPTLTPQEVRSASDILAASQAPVPGLDPRLLSAPQLRLQMPFYPSMLGASKPAHDMSSIMQQYALYAAGLPGMHGFPPTALVRSFSPTGNDGLESSRHVLSQDFATAQRMQMSAAAANANAAAAAAIVNANAAAAAAVVNANAAAAARGSPFSTTAASMPGSQVIVSNPNAVHQLIPQLHAGSPTSVERLNFIPQHPGSITSPLMMHASRGSNNPSRSTPTKSPASPHRPLTPHHPSKPHFSGPQTVPMVPESLLHPGVERRKSSSPHRTPSSDHYSPTFPSALATQIAPHESRRTPPAHYSTPPPPSRQTPQPKSFPVQDNPVDAFALARTRQNSPGSQHQRQRSSSPQVHPRVKQEVQQNEPIDPQRLAAMAEAQHRERQAHQNAIAVARVAERQRKEQQQQQALHMMHGQTPPHRMSVDAAGSSTHRKKDVGDPQDYDLTRSTHNEPAKDLKAKGRATMTTAHLINAIIDHNISQEFGVVDQLTQAQLSKSTELGGAMARHSPLHHSPRNAMHEAHGQSLKPTWPNEQLSMPKAPPRAQRVESPGVQQLQYVSNQAPPATTTKTLGEHSHDIISNLYVKDHEAKRHHSRQPEQHADRPDPQRQASAKPPSIPTGYSRHDLADKPPSVPQQAQLTPEFNKNPMSYLQHPLVPFPVSEAGPPQVRLENIIRHALLSSESAPSSRSTSPVARETASRSPRPDSRASPNVAPNQPEPQQARSKPADQKRTEPYSVPPTQQPAMFISALTFKAGQNTGAAPQHQAMRNLPARQSTVPGSAANTAAHMINNPATFHSQAHSPAPERSAPRAEYGYESLSDSE